MKRQVREIIAVIIVKDGTLNQSGKLRGSTLAKNGSAPNGSVSLFILEMETHGDL